MRSGTVLVTLALGALCNACEHARVELPPELLLGLDFEGNPRAAAVGSLDHDREGRGMSYEPGLDGHCIHFDGNSGLVYEDVAELAPGQALTLELYFSPDAWRNPYAEKSILEELVACGDLFSLDLQPDSWLLSARVKGEPRAEPATLVGGVVTAGSWHHAALVLDAGAGHAQLYLDGALTTEAPLAGRLRMNEDCALRVGASSGRERAYNGRIDALRLWNRVLGPAELAARAEAVSGPGN